MAQITDAERGGKRGIDVLHDPASTNPRLSPKRSARSWA